MNSEEGPSDMTSSAQQLGENSGSRLLKRITEARRTITVIRVRGSCSKKRARARCPAISENKSSVLLRKLVHPIPDSFSLKARAVQRHGRRSRELVIGRDHIAVMQDQSAPAREPSPEQTRGRRANTSGEL